MATSKTQAETTGRITVSAANIEQVTVKIIGDSPLMQCRFSAKAMQAMTDKMTGVTKPGTKARPNRNYDEDYKNAMHVSDEGWVGFPAASIRNACISACRLVGFKMTIAKMTVFAMGDGLDSVDGLPLIKIDGKPERTEMATRNATGVADIRVRPMWRKWSATVTIRFDADQFHLQDVLNLLDRAGQQVGIGEGRPDSKSSAGLGFGTFHVEAK